MRPSAIQRPPFLKGIRSKTAAGPLPYDVPAFRAGLDLAIRTPITFFVGENGSGKSTLLEAIARNIGFPVSGGSRDNHYDSRVEVDDFHTRFTFSWLPRVTNGFFFRAESFRAFADYVDDMGPAMTETYGGSLHARSHGESFLSLFERRLGHDRPAVYLLDEPEAALSPARQERFLDLLRRWQDSGRVQAIIASHAPILMSFPEATILHFGPDGIEPRRFEETDHYRVTRRYLGG